MSFPLGAGGGEGPGARPWLDSCFSSDQFRQLQEVTDPSLLDQAWGPQEALPLQPFLPSSPSLLTAPHPTPPPLLFLRIYKNPTHVPHTRGRRWLSSCLKLLPEGAQGPARLAPNLAHILGEILIEGAGGFCREGSQVIPLSLVPQCWGETQGLCACQASHHP